MRPWSERVITCTLSRASTSLGVQIWFSRASRRSRMLISWHLMGHLKNIWMALWRSSTLMTAFDRRGIGVSLRRDNYRVLGRLRPTSASIQHARVPDARHLTLRDVKNSVAAEGLFSISISPKREMQELLFSSIHTDTFTFLFTFSC